MSESILQALKNSTAYQRASALVRSILNNPRSTIGLLDRAQHILNARNLVDSGSLREMLDALQAAQRLLRSYARGEYRNVSKHSLALIVTALVYLVMPFDLIPDFIVALGFTDDAALLAWTLHSVSEEIDRFRRWEAHAESAEVS